MAFYDDKKFLLSYIRHAFMNCDGTGLCELVLQSEAVDCKPIDCDDENISLADLTLDVEEVNSRQDTVSQSCDIVSDMVLIGAHRRRSNTAQRLDRLRREKKNQDKIVNVQWKDAEKPLSREEMAELFPKKELPKVCHPQTKESLLSKELKKNPVVPNNPFSEYSQYDGRVNESSGVESFSVFLTMLPLDEQSYPMTVSVVRTASVQELIGLICWQYTNEGREPKLMPTVGFYCLYIAEETGEVELDFPSLDSKEPVAKFGFPFLALVQMDKEEPKAPTVTLFYDDKFSKIEVPDTNLPLHEFLEEVFEQNQELAKFKDSEFHLESRTSPGKPLEMDRCLNEIGTSEFRIVFDEESDSAIEESAEFWSFHEMEAPLYQSYPVSVIHKIGKNSEVQLGISVEKVEINPTYLKGSSKIFTRIQKPVSYNIEQIASCEMVNKKYTSGKSLFKLVYFNGTDYKSYMLESHTSVAREIIKKISHILKMHSSPIRENYLTYKQKKEQFPKKQSLQHTVERISDILKSQSK